MQFENPYWQSPKSGRNIATIVATIADTIMRESTIRDARNTLTALIREAEKGKPVRLTRHGKAVAVLISEKEYERLSARSAKKDPWEFLREWRAQLPEDFQGITDAEVDSWRDKSPDGGRKFSWDD